MVLLLVSFIGGALTVLAPCILPLLPVVVGGSLYDGSVNKRKALTIVAALGASVILFTILLKVSTLFITIPEYTWKLISGGIILTLGLVTLFPSLWEGKLLAKISMQSNALLGNGAQKNSVWGDVIVGASLGPIFSTCSPTYFIILATILPVSPLLGMVYLFSYTLGLCLSLFVVAFLGQKVMDMLGVVSDSRGLFKKTLGVLFLLVGISILTGYDKKIETVIVGAGFFDVTTIEQRLLPNDSATDAQSTGSDNLPALENGAAKSGRASYLTLEQKNAKYKKAPELSSIDGYINTGGKPVTLASLKGKVVLLDIWTYSCINCQRTLPYINEWYGKYKDKGFEVVGLHTPEFGFEKVQENVAKAVQGFGIAYPVVLDNDYSTWRALGNQYWPRKYLIDIDGYIVYDHIGEGGYADMEEAIQNALGERDERLGIADTVSKTISVPPDVISFDPRKVLSPEVYFGTSRNEYLANGSHGVEGNQSFVLPSTFTQNSLYLEGAWSMQSEYAENLGASNIVFSYDAGSVYMAAGSDVGVDIEIFRDDVFVKKVTVKDEKLYPLITGDAYGAHTLRIKIEKAGLKAFTFTFG